MPMLPATVCTSTFSTGEKGSFRRRGRELKKAKPIRLDGIDMVLTQPVCKPKYMLEKQMTRPTSRPTKMPRTVKLRPSLWGGPAPASASAAVGESGGDGGGEPTPLSGAIPGSRPLFRGARRSRADAGLPSPAWREPCLWMCDTRLDYCNGETGEGRTRLCS